MKSINFKRQSATIRLTHETKSKKPKNWDRIIYFVVLALIAGTLLNYLYSRFLLVRADGQILFENINIRLTADSRIMKYYVQEDDTVTEGDTLFSYEIDHLAGSDGQHTNTTIHTGSNDTHYEDWIWFDKEIYNLQNKIAQDQIILKKNETLIAEIEQHCKQLYQEVMLDVLPKDQLESAKAQLINLQAQSAQMKDEMGHAQQMIIDLEAKKSFYMRVPSNVNIEMQSTNTSSIAASTDAPHEGLNYYLSPVSGAVNRILTGQFEVAMKQDEIMSMRSNKQMFIKAFFDQEDVEYIKVNDLVDIKFPDGKNYIGIVKRFYKATYTLPEEFQKKFEPTTRDIAADIYPIDSSESINWQNFYKMSVKISKFKYR